MKSIAALILATLAAFPASGTEARPGSEDDLALVKRALNERAPGRKAEPQWLRIRVTEKGSRKAVVSVNLPLSFVRLLDDDWPVDLRCRRGERDRCSLRLGEVLRRLEAGQELIEVDDERGKVKIWVE